MGRRRSRSSTPTASPIQRCTAIAALAHEVPHRRPLRRHGGAAAPAPVLARIWFGEGPIERDPAFPGGSCDVGGPYTGYPCAGQNATGIPVPHPDFNGDARAAAVERRRRRRRSRRPRGCRRATASSPRSARSRRCARRAPNRNPELTIVGYGVAGPEAGRRRDRSSGCSRRSSCSTRSRSSLGDWNVLFSGRRGNDDPDDWWERDSDAGAACFGDSGGPVLADTRDGEVIIGVISFLLNENCKRPAVGYRVDTATRRASSRACGRAARRSTPSQTCAPAGSRGPPFRRAEAAPYRPLQPDDTGRNGNMSVS